MKEKTKISRRRFLESSGALGAASLFRVAAPTMAAIAQAACSARDEGKPFQTLGAGEAADFAAIAARIIPTTDTPGATEAGVIWFWDNALGGTFASMLDPIRSLREQMNDELGRPFVELTEDEQDAALRAVESDPRFELWRLMTIFGFFAMEKHGGNKDHVSWDLIGYKGHHGAWGPPFGYYDARVEQADGE